MNILAIETSCDETAVAIVSDKKEILSNLVFSQIKEHTPYGGVVPEIAARTHMDKLESLIYQALKGAKFKDFSSIDAIGVTAGPGLIGGLIVGVMVAKSIAFTAEKPIIAVNHLEGHALTPRLTHQLDFPYLLMLTSGGHCQIVVVKDVGNYKILGQTIDDAVGETFDKVAKALNLGYPGGPAVEALAKQGDATKYDFPRPLFNRPNCDFSFSGLKTAIRYCIDKLVASNQLEQEKANICASFQRCVSDILVNRLENALKIVQKDYPDIKEIILSGGVAANQVIRNNLQEFSQKNNVQFISPPSYLCTDNAAMIAWAALENFKKGRKDNINFAPKARWPLESLYNTNSHY